MADRQFARPEESAGVVRAAFGSSRSLAGVARVTGGSKKGVYRLTLDDGSTSILYVWSDAENYWSGSAAARRPSSTPDLSDPFSDASGLDLFTASHTRLTALGVRAPSIHLVDRSHRHWPADLALVEDVRGGTLEDLIARSPTAAETALETLSAMLAAMRRCRSPRYGKVALLDASDQAHTDSAVQVVCDRARGHLASAADQAPRIAAAKGRLDERLRSLAAAVQPRREHSLIHGELGPDHVLLDEDAQPVLIDIEGLMFFDAEWEHAFLRMRFGHAYESLRAPDLDPARLRLYEFAQSLSLIEGPLRIAGSDFPDRDFMLRLADWHTDQVLRGS